MLGVCFSIDHGDRRWTFNILDTRPPRSPWSMAGRRAFVWHETFSGELVLTV